MRVCGQCGTDISDRGPRARYCVPCAEERTRERVRKYHKANPEKLHKHQLKWREANREKEVDRVCKWRKANPEKYREQKRKSVRRRRARKRNQRGTITGIHSSSPNQGAHYSKT